MATCAELQQEYKTADLPRRQEIENEWLNQQCEGELDGDDLSGGGGPRLPPNP